MSSTSPGSRTNVTERDPALEPFDALIGSWATEATHPAFDAVVPGRITFEWLEGGHFLVVRAQNDHELFPDWIGVVGAPEGGDGLVMEYFDSAACAGRTACRSTTACCACGATHPASTSATPPRSGTTPSRASGSSPGRRATGRRPEGDVPPRDG